METIVKQGRLLFAVAIAALGAENLICAHVSQIVFEGNPNGVPVLPYATSPFIAYLVGIILLAVGVSVAASIRPEFAATFLGLFFGVYTLVHLLPIIVARPRDLNARTGVFEVLALCASALTLSACLKQKRASAPRSLAGCGKTRFEADGVPRNSLVSTAQPDKKKACVEKTSSSWMCLAT